MAILGWVLSCAVCVAAVLDYLAVRKLLEPSEPGNCYNCTAAAGEWRRPCPADCGSLGRSQPAIWCLLASLGAVFLVLEPGKVGCASV